MLSRYVIGVIQAESAYSLLNILTNTNSVADTRQKAIVRSLRRHVFREHVHANKGIPESLVTRILGFVKFLMEFEGHNGRASLNAAHFAVAVEPRGPAKGISPEPIFASSR